MATSKKPKALKEPKEQLTLADNPSLIKAGDEIHLRVLDDFFVEEDLPKWKQFKSDWENLKQQLKIHYEHDAESIIKKLEDPKEQEAYMKRLESYKKGKKKIEDDKWNIKGKHEKSVAESLEKTVRLTTPLSLKDKILIKLGLKKPLIPMEIAFEDLKAHLLHTTTKEMAEKKAILDAAEKKFRELGQYNKADQVKAYTTQIIEEQALVDAGFTIYVTEQMMIDFISKSERGVMVDFLRYYDGIIPDEVAEVKRKADKTMIFDNYVIAHYADIKKEAKKAVAAKKHKEAEEVIAKRRDPILFGIIKESRKLFYLADWVTPDDDLTLKVLEEALGQKGLKLDDTSRVDPTVAGVVGGSNNTASALNEIGSMMNDDRRDRAAYTRSVVYSSDDNGSTTVYNYGTRFNRFEIQDDITPQF